MVLANLSCGKMEDVDNYYKLREGCEDLAVSRFHPKRGKTLSARRWKAAFTPEGRLMIDKVLPRIERGGLHPSIRGQVWEFLLGCYSSNSTTEERAALRKFRREQYAKMKLDCRAIDPAIGSGIVVTLPRITEDGGSVEKQEEQLVEEADAVLPPVNSVNIANGLNEKVDEATTPSDPVIEKSIAGTGLSDKRIMQWELLLHQIGLDVVRTDRMLQFYEEPKNLAKLWDILAVYAWFDEEVGYCQGMSDLCSAMVVLFPDEADAFWCFERLMLRVRENFRSNGPVLGVLKQLAVLGSVIEVVDTRLHKHLEALGGGTYMFALRMLMVLFRREFSFSDTLYLWEMIWASEYDSPSHSLQGEQNYLVTWKEPRKEAALRRGKSYNSKGKFVRRTIKYGTSSLDRGGTSLSVFCAAGILEMHQRKLLRGTQGLDDVVKLLNDTAGKVDARQTCKRGLRLYKEYLIKLAAQ